MTDQLQSFPQEDRRHLINWRNDSGETVPAFGIVQATSFDEDELVYSIDKPGAVGDLFFVNGPQSVDDGDYGDSMLWEHGPVALIEEGSTTPSSMVGPIEDSWKLGHGTRFQMLTTISNGVAGVTTAGACRRRRAIMLGKLDKADSTLGALPPTAYAALVYTTSTGVLAYERKGSGSVRSVLVANFFVGIEIEQGTYVKIEELHGWWEPYAADCPPEDT